MNCPSSNICSILCVRHNTSSLSLWSLWISSWEDIEHLGKYSYNKAENVQTVTSGFREFTKPFQGIEFYVKTKRIR